MVTQNGEPYATRYTQFLPCVSYAANDLFVKKTRLCSLLANHRSSMVVRLCRKDVLRCNKSKEVDPRLGDADKQLPDSCSLSLAVRHHH